MGEARRRKDADPAFGRLARDLVEKKRGVLISPEINIDDIDGQTSIRTGEVDPHQLRYALLFWDDIAVSRHNMIQFQLGDDVDSLIEGGFIKEVTIHAPLLELNKFEAVHIPAFKHLDEMEPGKWSMATGEKSFNWLAMPLGSSDQTVVELVRAIPIPDEDAPFEDIFEFKAKRLPELQRLMAEIDKFGAIISRSETPISALNSHRQHIETACLDVLRTGREWQLPLRISNIKCSLDITLDKVIRGYERGDVFLDLPVIGSLIGAAASCVKISADVKRQPMKPRLGPYQYVYEIHNRLF
ncbi:MAG: DUF6236 family protein [Burkholderiaceae bacterium]